VFIFTWLALFVTSRCDVPTQLTSPFNLS